MKQTNKMYIKLERDNNKKALEIAMSEELLKLQLFVWQQQRWWRVHEWDLLSGEIRIDIGGDLTYAAVAVEGPRWVVFLSLSLIKVTAVWCMHWWWHCLLSSACREENCFLGLDFALLENLVQPCLTSLASSLSEEVSGLTLFINKFLTDCDST